MKRLLVIACSERKKPDAGLLPSIERYDGPVFRVLRKYLREAPQHAPAVLILSAKYGLMAADQDIPYYDRRLTTASARELRPMVLDSMRKALWTGDWSTVGVCAGKVYRIALEGLSDLVPDAVPLNWVAGGQGTRLANLKKWLRESESP